MSIDPASTNRKDPSDTSSGAAVDLIRRKVAAALGEAPSVVEQAMQPDRPLSKHQLYMRELQNSGKSLAEVQTEWHRYYTLLGDAEKNEVWREFYAAHEQTPYQKLFEKGAYQPAPQQPQTPQPTTLPSGVTVSRQVAAPTPTSHAEQTKPVHPTIVKLKKQADLPAVRAVRKQINRHVSANGQLKIKQHLQSLLFGVGVGTVVLVVLLFGFFNEYVIAPFIQPSRKVSAETPIIMSDSIAATANPTVIVSKINIQIPIDFSVKSIDEATMQASLEGGVVHYPSTAKPGENGNGAYFGHSSQNVFNNGKYKFAFVLLHQITTGDVFQIIYNGKVYSYQVFYKEVVPPTQVSVLSDTRGKQATAVLITCDPPGFSTNRLVVWGEQISPSVASNVDAATATETTTAPTALQSKGPSWWSGFIDAIQFWKKDPISTSSGG